MSYTNLTSIKQAGKGGELTHDETTIIAGALELTEKKAKDAMTPLSETFAIDINAKLDRFVIFRSSYLTIRVVKVSSQIYHQISILFT